MSITAARMDSYCMEELSALRSKPVGWYVAGSILLVLSFAVRLFSYGVVTSDYTYFVAKWLGVLASHPGLSAFSDPFADYAPLYLYILKLLTYIPVSSLVSVKTLSFFGDIAIAAFACLILKRLDPNRFSGGKLFFSFAVMLSIPTVILNSSLWGQSDSLYGAALMAAAFFCVAADMPLAAALSVGIAMSLKVQTIFFLPVLLGYLAARGELRQALWVPLTYIFILIPAIVGGGNFWYWFLIYGKQAGEYKMLTVNAPSLFAFFPAVPTEWNAPLFTLGIILAAVSALVAGSVAYRATKTNSNSLFLLTIVFSVISIAFFLPRMHERYFYLADIFSVLFALYRPRMWYLPVLVVSASLLSYLPYLSASVPAFAYYIVDLRIPAAAMAAGLCLVVWPIVYSRFFSVTRHIRTRTLPVRWLRVDSRS